MLSTTERTIEEAFSKHASVERVKKIRDYAFVHFFCKEGAHQAMQAMNGWCRDHWSSHGEQPITSCVLYRINSGRCSPGGDLGQTCGQGHIHQESQG